MHQCYFYWFLPSLGSFARRYHVIVIKNCSSADFSDLDFAHLFVIAVNIVASHPDVGAVVSIGLRVEMCQYMCRKILEIPCWLSKSIVFFLRVLSISTLSAYGSSIFFVNARNFSPTVFNGTLKLTFDVAAFFIEVTCNIEYFFSIDSRRNL